MSVYAIAQLWIHDPARYGRYVDRFMDVFKNYRGECAGGGFESGGVRRTLGWKSNGGAFVSGRSVVSRLGGVAGVSGDCGGPESCGEDCDYDGARDCRAERSGDKVTNEALRWHEKQGAVLAASCQEIFRVKPPVKFCEACGGEAPAFVSHAVRGWRRCGS